MGKGGSQAKLLPHICLGRAGAHRGRQWQGLCCKLLPGTLRLGLGPGGTYLRGGGRGPHPKRSGQLSVWHGHKHQTSG
jgi:hypothetical protein